MMRPPNKAETPPHPPRLSKGGDTPPGSEGAGSLQPQCHVTAGSPSTHGNLNIEEPPLTATPTNRQTPRLHSSSGELLLWNIIKTKPPGGRRLFFCTGTGELRVRTLDEVKRRGSKRPGLCDLLFIFIEEEEEEGSESVGWYSYINI